MKIITTSFLAILLLAVSSCSEEQSDRSASALVQIQQNHMDLPGNKPQFFKGIEFQLSELFEKRRTNRWVIKTDGAIYDIEDLSLYVTLELFDQNDVKDALQQYEDGLDISPLFAIHDMYAGKRINSLNYSNNSIVKELESSKFPGITQVITGSEYENDIETSYFMATIEAKEYDEYYVVQMIGRKDAVGYLYDDFLDIIASIQ